MRIVLDLQTCQARGSRDRGIGRYSNSLGQSIARLRENHEIRIVLSGLYPDEANHLEEQFAHILPKNFFSRYYYFETHPLVNRFPMSQGFMPEVGQLLIQHHYMRLQPDLLHISSVFETELGKSLTLNANKLRALNHVIRSATIYDLIPLLFKEMYLTDPVTQSWYYNRLNVYKTCDLLLAISETTRQDAIHHLNISPERIVNISAACDAQFKPITFDINEINSVKNHYGINKDFLLYIGGDDPRKNMEGLIQSYARIPQKIRLNHQLVIVCSIQSSRQEALINLLKNLGLELDEVKFTGFVPDHDLIKLYNLCKLFVFPSIYEGFGLPVLEAMQCGAPVIGANNSSICEIIGREDALFDTNNAETLTQLMVKVLTDKNLRLNLSEYSRKRAKDFTWENSAKLALEAFSEAKARKQISNKKQLNFILPRRRIAYFSPLPNQRSGIADYSAALLPELNRYFDIDLFIDDYEVKDDWIINNFNIYHYNDYPSLHVKYDLSLYHLGNSEFHAYMVDLLLHYGGVIVLHDFFLSGLINWLGFKNQNPTFLENELIYSHGESELSSFKHLNEPERTTQMIMGYPCNRRVLECVDGIIVHSPHSLDLMNKFYPLKIHSSIHVIKQLQKRIVKQSDKLEKKQSLDLSEKDFIICSFGMLDSTKLNHVLIDAFVNSNLAKQKNVKLIFVGELPEGDFARLIKNKINASELTEKIQILGYLESEKYHRYLAIADLAVQLRTASRGETSRAVLDCLAYGIPTIVNAYANLAEFPDDVVCKVSAHACFKEISQALDLLYKDENLRNHLSKKSVEYIRDHHDPELIAADYAVSLHEFIERSRFTKKHILTKELAKVLSDYPEVTQDELRKISSYVLANEKN